MDVKRFLHVIILASNNDAITSAVNLSFPEPYALVSVYRVSAAPGSIPELLPAALFFRSDDPYAVVADGVQGLPYHAELARPGSLVVSDNFFYPAPLNLMAVTVLTASFSPPIVTSTSDVVFLAVYSAPVYDVASAAWLQEVSWGNVGQPSTRDFWRNVRPQNSPPSPITVNMLLSQGLALGWEY